MNTKEYINNYVTNGHVLKWIGAMKELCNPDKVVFCDGSKEEKEHLTEEAFKTGELIELNREKLPGCVLHRTAQNDVARTEHLTYICTTKKEDAGHINNWMSPEDAYKELSEYFRNSMKGRTMYVIPFIMGVPGSSMNKIGIELTDSIYVVLNMRIMTHAGKIAADALGDSPDFTKCLHGKAELDYDKRRICHFPEDNTIWSVNSGYGGNVLLGKKCLALRIASYMGRHEEKKWMAEHMFLMGIKTPEGKTFYIAGAFPSACGKTNLSMLIPPEELSGYKIQVVGDDISWMYAGDDGRLWALNPETGFFGVAPGTNMKTNKNAMLTINRDTIYTNVLLKDDKTVWWEGLENKPEKGLDWKGDPWTKDMKDEDGKPIAGAQPNSRFTAPTSNCPIVSPEFSNPKGVPVSAILFGGRRARVAPLVYEAFNWQHGVYVGATMASETTTAQLGAVGVIRRDPMAMLPFCGYNMGDYFQNWLDMGKKLKNPPKIFNVNWFKVNDEGKFMWPGFGDNLRVLEWIIKRCEDNSGAEKTPVGYVPMSDALNTKGLDISKQTLDDLLSINPGDWNDELKDIKNFFEKFDRLPGEILEEYNALYKRFDFD
ncbi:phosphoenolpyruvate carboxykinase [Candidatus Altiarchaeales archaeon WOR_SM1_SCG]|nr:phosphoenolpyruvate carboxykinase [Candidatus Altiarchaeales archaeon WOR_SM1_SCG]